MPALDDEQYDKILELAESEEAQFMLSAPITEPADDNLDPTAVGATADPAAGAPQARPGRAAGW